MVFDSWNGYQNGMTPQYIRVPQIMFSDVGDDIVALNVGAGLCFGMEDVSAEVWRLLARPHSLDLLCAELLKSYDVDAAECRRDISELLDQLTAEGLVKTV